MSPATASTRRAAAAATLHLPFRVPAKEFFSLKEAAALMELSDSFVEKLYDKGVLSGHSHNAGHGKRDTKRILRPYLVAYMIRTADYCDDTLVEALTTCLRGLSAPQLAELDAAIVRELTRRANA